MRPPPASCHPGKRQPDKLAVPTDEAQRQCRLMRVRNGHDWRLSRLLNINAGGIQENAKWTRATLAKYNAGAALAICCRTRLTYAHAKNAPANPKALSMGGRADCSGKPIWHNKQNAMRKNGDEKKRYTVPISATVLSARVPILGKVQYPMLGVFVIDNPATCLTRRCGRFRDWAAHRPHLSAMRRRCASGSRHNCRMRLCEMLSKPARARLPESHRP